MLKASQAVLTKSNTLSAYCPLQKLYRRKPGSRSLSGNSKSISKNLSSAINHNLGNVLDTKMIKALFLGKKQRN
jgi:hypothetical protein